MIDLARGHPNSKLLPAEEVQALLSSLSDNALRNGLNYGDEQGSREFLGELGAFLQRHGADDDYGSLQDEKRETNMEKRLFTTIGVSHGLDMLCAAQTRPGDVVLVERPTYYLVRGILENHGLTVRGLPMKDSSGTVDVDKLVELVESGEMEAPEMIYLVPTHGNPSGHTMPIEERIKLAKFAIRHYVLVVADEVYHLLDWRDTERDGPRPARMASLSAALEEDLESGEFGTCVSVSSFTKIFAPGVRCGWIEGGRGIIQSLVNFGFIQSQGGCAPFMGEVMHSALESRVADDVLDKLRQAYKIRANLVCSALTVEPRIQITNQPLGGYFIWIKFPDCVNSLDFLDYCDGRVKFLPGVKCDAIDEDAKEGEHLFETHARLCFADLDDDKLVDGITELVMCFLEYMPNP